MKDHACLSCPNTDKCREVWAESNRGPLTSRGLAVCSAVAFLLPLTTAIIAGTATRAAGFSENAVILLSAAGLAVGGVMAALLVFILKKRFSRVTPDCQEHDTACQFDEFGQ